MTSLLQIVGTILIFISLISQLTKSPALINAYALNANTKIVTSPLLHHSVSSASSPAAAAAVSTSSLASKVIFQSPAMENVYKEFVVASKPLTLRKYNKSGGKIKKTRKESKIYYIPIPPMPYRYIPGIGYDYQPMRINPILQDAPMPDHLSTTTRKGERPQQQSPYGYGQIQQNYNINNNINNKKSKIKSEQEVKGSDGLITTNSSTSSFTASNINSNAIEPSESKLIRMNRGDYFFNGRPFILQVAHAQNKNYITPQNLKSKLYFNKKIIF